MCGSTPLVRQWILLRTLWAQLRGVAHAELAPVYFNRPEGFGLHEHLAGSLGVFHGDGQVHVRVWFSPTLTRYVQGTHWHASQELTHQSDGSLLAEFDLDGTEELQR